MMTPGKIVNLSCNGRQEDDGTCSVVLIVGNLAHAEVGIIGNALQAMVPKLVADTFAKQDYVEKAELIAAPQSTDTPQ